jgi:hypothetical protein
MISVIKLGPADGIACFYNDKAAFSFFSTCGLHGGKYTIIKIDLHTTVLTKTQF